MTFLSFLFFWSSKRKESNCDNNHIPDNALYIRLLIRNKNVVPTMQFSTFSTFSAFGTIKNIRYGFSSSSSFPRFPSFPSHPIQQLSASVSVSKMERVFRESGVTVWAQRVLTPPKREWLYFWQRTKRSRWLFFGFFSFGYAKEKKVTIAFGTKEIIVTTILKKVISSI